MAIVRLIMPLTEAEWCPFSQEDGGMINMNAESATGIEGFSTITLQVADLERSVRFYGDSLGLNFDVQYSGNARGAMVGDVLLLLHRDFQPESIKQERGVGIELHFSIPDADAYLAQLKQRGVEAEEEPKDQPWGRVFSVSDPDGYAIEFVAPLPVRTV